MNDENVTLPSGEIISKEFYEKLIGVTSKRPKMSDGELQSGATAN